MINPELLHYCAAGLSIALGSIGGGIGQGIAGTGGQSSMLRQPTGSDAGFKATIIGLALIESGTIVALVTTLYLLFTAPEIITFEFALVELGIGLSVGTSAAITSLASSFVVRETTEAISRQPFFSSKIMPFMLICQSIIESPVIFAFLIALLTKTQLNTAINIYQSISLFSANLVIALGSIGPSIGQAMFSRSACKAIGLNKNAYNKIFPYTLINQALIETPMIFCILLALIMIFNPLGHIITLLISIKFLVAAVTVALGTLGVGIGLGMVTSKGCQYIALEPSCYNAMIRITLLAIAFVESIAIYALIVGMLLIMKA